MLKQDSNSVSLNSGELKYKADKYQIYVVLNDLN